jgi:hypothetical protein
MKKLLVLTFVLLLSAGATADRGDMYFFIGTPDGSDLAVGIDKWVPVNVYFQCGPDFTGPADTTEAVLGADLTYPLGINNCYVDAFDSLQCVFHFPFTQWDSKAFQNLYEDFYNDGTCDWDSYSFQGFAELFPPYDSPLMDSDVPALGLTFGVHTLNRPEVLDSVICDAVGPGEDPISGLANCGDPAGGQGYNVIEEFACWWFSPNQAPTIELLYQPGEYCSYEDFQLLFDVVDPDEGDVVDVSSTLGTPVLLGTEPEGDGTRFHYALDFDMEEACGECLSDSVFITANDGNNDPVTEYGGYVTLLGLMTASMDPAIYIWPGMEEWMPVYLDVCAECFCLGGFVFTIEWDASIFTYTDIMPGTMLLGGEYWNVNVGVSGPGTLRVTFINDLNNQEPVEPICGLLEEPLFYVKFLLDPGFPYNEYTDFCSPVCFMFDADGENHYEFNNVSDDGGYHVWFNDGCDDAPDSVQYGTLELDFECGNLKVVGDHSVFAGDINWNGFPFEVGDAVLLANHLIDPIAYPFNLRQMFASDVNNDGIQASIADLIYLINVINGYGLPKVAPLDVVATVSIPAEAYGDMAVRVTSQSAVGGALIEINHTGVELGAPVAEGMDIRYSDNGDVMTVVVYNMESVSFAPGTNILFTVPVQSEGAVSLGDVSVSDNRGALLDARGEVTAPIPTEFSVNQNFPNPFNAKTSIRFGLPTDADVTVNIYNVAGQLVESMDLGHTQAGTHSIVWDASDVASGIYFYKVAAGDYNETMKMTLLK